VDTSVVHLVGAMGKAMWVLLPRRGDWRWMRGKEDSAWYASARLFWQKKLGEWDGVVERVAVELSALGKNAEC
jgi:hypothetical protein